jgi:pilus assembly protein CpaE
MIEDSAPPTREEGMHKQLQIHAIGTCPGLSEALHDLEATQQVELLGWSEDSATEAPGSTGAAPNLVLYATTTTFPAERMAWIREYTSAPVIVVTSVDSTELLDGALAAGAADVVELPRDDLFFAMRKVHSAARLERSSDFGRVISVFCPKGGVGKTTVAVNLAAALATMHGKRTLLIDLDLQFGDVSLMLGLEPRKTIYDLMVGPGELDAEKLMAFATPHASGMDVLPAPLRPEEADLVTELRVARLIEVARSCYDVVLVDTAPFFHGPMLSTFDRTDDLLLLCGVDVATIKNVRLGLDTLELLRFPKDRITVVLNRPNAKAGISRRELEGALEQNVRFELPADDAVLRWLNQGSPVVLRERKSPYASAMRKLAGGLAAGNTPPRRRVRGRLLSRA